MVVWESKGTNYFFKLIKITVLMNTLLIANFPDLKKFPYSQKEKNLISE